VSPAGSGAVNVTVTTPGGTSSITAADVFNYVTPAAPTVTSLSPVSGPTSGGTEVVLSGTGFSGATAVEFGATAATTFSVTNDTRILAVSPAGTVGPVNVRVVTAGGTSAIGPANAFSYFTPSVMPVVTGVSPVSGPTAGGNTVVITGMHFSGATVVAFGTVAAASTVTDTQITATAPAENAGTIDVTVTTPNGLSATSIADEYTYVGANTVPTITSVSPGSGPTAGGTTLTITGSGFTSVTSVVVGSGVATGVNVLSSTELTAVTPASSTPGAVGVTVVAAAGRSNLGVFDYVGSAPPPPPPPPPLTGGYWLAASDGGIFSFNKPFLGSTGNIALAAPIVGVAQTADGGGYWLVARDGRIFNFGDATNFGSVPGLGDSVNNIVGMVADPETGGYWLIGSDGSVWAFHAPQYGDLPIFGFHVNNIVGGAVTPDGGGMYLVGADGHVYVMVGDGINRGDVSGLRLNAPIVGMAVDPATGGYWLLGRDGGVFSFNAPFYGSTGNLVLNRPVVGMEPTANGGGYWFVASDGGVFAYGNAPFRGSTGNFVLNQPVIGMAGS
jgi:hypothetical protein